MIWFSIIPLILFSIHMVITKKKLKEDNDRLRIAVIENDFPITFDAVARQIHANAVRHGFWPDNGRNKGEAIALIHSEASELLEAVRQRIDINDSGGEMEECADIVIRVMDYAHGYYPGMSLGSAIVDKCNQNISRPTKHGKEF